MSKYAPVTRTRHRRHWLQAQPRRMVIAVCVLWLVPMLALWVNLNRDEDPRLDSPAPADIRVGGSYAARPSAAGRLPGAPPVGASATATVPAGTGPIGGTGPGSTPGAPAARPSRSPIPQLRDPQPPRTPLLTVTTGTAPSSVDLSAEGSVDWVHWGLRSPGSINRKAGGAQAITDEGGTGPRERSDTSPQRFSWRDGAPDRTASGSTTSVFSCGLDGGFRFSVAAGPQTRTLRFYAGVLRATGRLEVSLSGTGLSRSATLTSTAEFSSLRKRFAITFRAPAGGRLHVRWTVTQIFNQYCADVSMQAATLR